MYAVLGIYVAGSVTIKIPKSGIMGKNVKSARWKPFTMENVYIVRNNGYFRRIHKAN